MRIKRKVYDHIVAHAIKDNPIEACGYLATKDGLVCKHYELTNMDHSKEHFSFDAKEQFAVLKDVRNLEMELSAVYHSHPETPARPSEEDIRLAYDPNISYVIISLAEKEESVKSFLIKNNTVVEELIEIVD